MDFSFMTEVFPGILMLVVFLIMTIGMYTRRISALLALPIMAFLFAVIGVVEYLDFFYILRRHMGKSSFLFLLWSLEGWLVITALLSFLSKRKMVSGVAALWGSIGLFFLAILVNIPGMMPLFDISVLTELLATIHIDIIMNDIIASGAVKLHTAYTVAIFGGMLAILVKEKKIAETFIKYAAELGGDNPILVAMLMMLVCFMLFTTLGGLGAIIMVGTIILPIMMSLGIHPLVAGGVLLIGLSAGGTFNPANWALYEESLMVDRQKIQMAAVVMIVLYLSMGAVFVTLSMKKKRRRRYFAQVQSKASDTKVRPIALLSPIVPIILVFQLSTFVQLAGWLKGKADWLDNMIAGAGRIAYFWDTYVGAWDFIPAFIAGILFCLITTWDWKGRNIRVLTKAMIEGAESVMPAVILMLGIGMLLNAVWHPSVSRYLEPMIKPMIPESRFFYILVFGLAAPLALYRGPLNLWGLGLGVALLVYRQSALSAAAVMGIFLTTGAMQGVCDPTNTHNVWIATYISEDVIQLSKKLLVYVWVMIFVGLFIMSFLFPLKKTEEEQKELQEELEVSMLIPEKTHQIPEIPALPFLSSETRRTA